MPDDIYKSQPRRTEHHAKVLIVTADKTEDLEFFYPYYRFLEEGYSIDVATPKGGKFSGKNGMGLAETLKLSNVKADIYDLLYIPGGKAPETLKKVVEAVALVKAFSNTNKPIAAICHGPQLLAQADIIRNRRIAAWPEVQEEVEEAGAEYCNQEAVQDGMFITGRWPADLPAFTSLVLHMVNRLATRASHVQAA